LIPKQELDELTFNRHRLVFQISGREGVMGESLSTDHNGRGGDKQHNQITLHIRSSLTEPMQ